MSEDDDRDLAVEEQLEKVERKRKRRARDEERRIEDAYKDVMATEAGRIVFWHMLGDLGLYSSPLAGTTELTYVQIGRHNAALELLARLNGIAPEHAKLMHKENVT